MKKTDVPVKNVKIKLQQLAISWKNKKETLPSNTLKAFS